MAINITSGGKPEEKLEWAFQMYAFLCESNYSVTKKLYNLIEYKFNISS